MLCILYAYFLVGMTPSFTLSQLCDIYPQLDENLWGVYACVLPYAAICIL